MTNVPTPQAPADRAAATLFDMSGKLALITGGSRGLGREMAQTFAEAGADVVIASRKADACRAAAAEIAESTGRTVVGLGCHVGNWDEVTRLAQDVLTDHGRCDVLVNNAGMSPLYRDLSSITEELWDKVLDVNLKGPFRLSALIGEHMAANGGGSIINISSVASTKPSKVEVPYGAAKAGLNNLTTGLAHALGPTVRVNCIAPGAFATDISKAWDLDAVNASMRDNAPLQRVGEPHEIAALALWLASDAASYATGATFKLDGGLARSV